MSAIVNLQLSLEELLKVSQPEIFGDVAIHPAEFFSHRIS